MTNIWTDGLKELLDTEAGDDATYKPAAGTAKPIRVFFSKADAREMGMEGSIITVEALTSEVTGAKVGDTVTVRGTAYKIARPPYDGDDGMTALDLSID